jgi:hypothetical protein
VFATASLEIAEAPSWENLKKALASVFQLFSDLSLKFVREVIELCGHVEQPLANFILHRFCCQGAAALGLFAKEIVGH